MKKLSVSIVAFRNYYDITRAIRTLNKFNPQSIDVKIYVIDNSDFRSKEEAINRMNFESWLSKYSNIDYINVCKNIGFGRGHNYVIERLDSEYHCIMNPDIIFLEDVFSPILEYMDSNKNIGMVIPNMIDRHGKRQLVCREEITVLDMFIRMFCKRLFPKRVFKHTMQYEDYSKPFQVPFGQGSFLIIRTELFKRIHGFDDCFFMYLEDADLCKRVNKESMLIYYPYATVIHEWRKGSHKNVKLFLIHVKSAIYYFKKWGIKFK